MIAMNPYLVERGLIITIKVFNVEQTRARKIYFKTLDSWSYTYTYNHILFTKSCIYLHHIPGIILMRIGKMKLTVYSWFCGHDNQIPKDRMKMCHQGQKPHAPMDEPREWEVMYPVLLIDTVKPVYNDHLLGYFSAFWSSSRWPRAT